MIVDNESTKYQLILSFHNGDEAVVNEPAKATIIWADDLVPDSTESIEKE